jgi:hypothetical protein
MKGKDWFNYFPNKIQVSCSIPNPETRLIKYLESDLSTNFETVKHLDEHDIMSVAGSIIDKTNTDLKLIEEKMSNSNPSKISVYDLLEEEKSDDEETKKANRAKGQLTFQMLVSGKTKGRINKKKNEIKNRDEEF